VSNIKIPWAKPSIGYEELNEVVDSFESNWLTMGPKVSKFEEKMADFLNASHAIAVSNGTVAEKQERTGHCWQQSDAGIPRYHCKSDH